LEFKGDVRKKARLFLELNPLTAEWTAALKKNVELLWADETLQKSWSFCANRQTQVFHMNYMVDNLERFCEEDFLPNDEDILRARQRTTGFSTLGFEIDKTSWKIVDVGGQLPEQQKWQSILNGEDGEEENIEEKKGKAKEKKVKRKGNTTAVVYFAALDEYNVISSEDSTKTKLDISLSAFEMLENSDTSSYTLIIFLNKVDIFKNKIASKKEFESFKTTFPDYTGTQNVQEAAEYVLSLFKARTKRDEMDINFHVTCALDSEAMGVVFKAVADTLVRKRMAASGIVI